MRVLRYTHSTTHYSESVRNSQSALVRCHQDSTLNPRSLGAVPRVDAPGELGRGLWQVRAARGREWQERLGGRSHANHAAAAAGQASELGGLASTEPTVQNSCASLPIDPKPHRSNDSIPGRVMNGARRSRGSPQTERRASTKRRLRCRERTGLEINQVTEFTLCIGDAQWVRPCEHDHSCCPFLSFCLNGDGIDRRGVSEAFRIQRPIILSQIQRFHVNWGLISYYFTSTRILRYNLGLEQDGMCGIGGWVWNHWGSNFLESPPMQRRVPLSPQAPRNWGKGAIPVTCVGVLRSKLGFPQTYKSETKKRDAFVLATNT